MRRPIDAGNAELGIDLEDGRVGEILAGLRRIGFDPGITGRPQLFPRYGLRVTGLDNVMQHFLPDAGFEALANDMSRHLSRTETLELPRSCRPISAAPRLPAQYALPGPAPACAAPALLPLSSET